MKKGVLRDLIEFEFSDDDQLRSIITEKGFFENLEPIHGTIEAVKEMETIGFTVFFCTFPIIFTVYQKTIHGLNVTLAKNG